MWSPRGRPWPWGHFLKSLAMVSKPQVLENCPVLGSRTTLFLSRSNFVGKHQKPCWKSAKNFFWFHQVEIAWKTFFEDLFHVKKIFEDLFFLENTWVCVLGLGLKRVCPWPWNFFVFLALASSLVSSTPPLILIATGNLIRNASRRLKSTYCHIVIKSLIIFWNNVLSALVLNPLNCIYIVYIYLYYIYIYTLITSLYIYFDYLESIDAKGTSRRWKRSKGTFLW